MGMRISLRLKVALAFSALAILLLAAQALGVKALAETQEEKFINALIADDMRDLLRSYRANPASMPQPDPRLQAYVSQEGGLRVRLPGTVAQLPAGIHELILDGREIHVAVAAFAGSRIYRIYDYGIYERHFKQVNNALMAGTGIFALLTIWLAFGLSGLLVRQITGMAQQVRALRAGAAEAVNPGKYDEIEVVELAETFNDYHRRMTRMVEREKEFAGNVSHELRTPLTAIRTSCELLQMEDAMALNMALKQRERLQRIERAVNRMDELVDALLLLARGEGDARAGPVCLADAVAEAVDGLADALAARKADIRVDIAAELRVEANRSALGIVLSNLIQNAARHIDQGHIRFSYEAGALHIEDTGDGIPPESLPRIFERFYQARPAEDDGRGFGIGLAIVRQLCERNEWPIRIASEPGKGTRVSLYLPVVK